MFRKCIYVTQSEHLGIDQTDWIHILTPKMLINMLYCKQNVLQRFSVHSLCTLAKVCAKQKPSENEILIITSFEVAYCFKSVTLKLQVFYKCYIKRFEFENLVRRNTT